MEKITIKKYKHSEWLKRKFDNPEIVNKLLNFYPIYHCLKSAWLFGDKGWDEWRSDELLLEDKEVKGMDKRIKEYMKFLQALTQSRIEV